MLIVVTVRPTVTLPIRSARARLRGCGFVGRYSATVVVVAIAGLLTATGTEIPTYFKIQILTITGKVIREITQDELGYIHIGRNITDFAWNGKDQFGDQLANGVYLYRVVTSIKGSTIEKRESGADEYFKKGFGKMYLMR